jgi:two-component system chemotaxis response regulator CheB
MQGHDIIVVGASAGGVEALTKLVQHLPPGLPAAMFVVCHFPNDGKSLLPQILSRSGPLLARHATNGEHPYPGHIYVAPPGHQLLLENGRMHLSRGPRENHHRPAIDSLFRSAARVHGPRVVGVVLSGSMYDGVAGLRAIRSAGGLAVVQDPKDAVVSTLPANALAIAGADHVAPLAALAPLLVKLVRQPVPAKGGQVANDPLDKMPRTVSRSRLTASASAR